MCVFMGREKNIQVLHRYIMLALQTGVVDRYYMIDMTRNMSDHQHIQQEHARMNSMFPGRVDVVNSKVRRRQLIDGTWQQQKNQWAPFYKFCESFTDHDIIIKCDDDTLFIDVNALSSACDTRWNNRQPVLMHSNSINNGVCAYHQANHGVWRFDQHDKLKMYPSQGLTGPLFTNPELAADCHEQFTTDLQQSPDNVDKYKLPQDVYFTNRISINFMLLLGLDRHLFSSVNYQDEYTMSCKIGQQTDRPNMILSDLITSHHGYQTQENILKSRGTFQMYNNLPTWSHNHVHTSSPPVNCSTIRTDSTHYIMKHPATHRSYLIKHQPSQQYVSIDWRVKQTPMPITMKTRHRGLQFTDGDEYENIMRGSADQTLATLFDLDIHTETTINFNNSAMLISTGGLNSCTPGIVPNKSTFSAIMLNRFFRQSHLKETVMFEPQSDQSYRIRSTVHPQYTLCAHLRKHFDHSVTLNMYWSNHDTCTWELQPMTDRDVMLGNIVKDTTNMRNDGIYCVDMHLNHQFRTPRDYYWNVNHHVWKFTKTSADDHIISVVDDENPPNHLSYDMTTNQVIMSSTPDHWTLNHQQIQHVQTGMYLNITSDNQVVMTDQPGVKLLYRN